MIYPHIGSIDISLWLLVYGIVGAVHLSSFLWRASYVATPVTSAALLLRTNIINATVGTAKFAWCCIGLNLYSGCYDHRNTSYIEAPTGSMIAYTAIMGLMYYAVSLLTSFLLCYHKGNLYCSKDSVYLF